MFVANVVLSDAVGKHSDFRYPPIGHLIQQVIVIWISEMKSA